MELHDEPMELYGDHMQPYGAIDDHMQQYKK